MDHASLTELAAGAALDDLSPSERAAFEAHVGTCSDCRSLMAELDELLGDLALVAPALQPPARLRGDLLERLREPEPAPTTVASITDRPATAGSRTARRGPNRSTWGALALAAGLGVVALGLGARTVQVSDELAVAQAALAAVDGRSEAELAAMTLMADPRHVTAALHPEPVAPGAHAVVLYRPGTDQAFLLATDLPATQAGSVYQLWVADGDGVHPLGTFVHDGSGPVVAPFGVDLGDSVAAMVTVEPAGGVVGDPGPEVVFGEL